EALAQMKKDGSLEQIIQKWTASTTTASPTTTTAAGQKATPTLLIAFFHQISSQLPSVLLRYLSNSSILQFANFLIS
ncbi:MAG: hypothetical protein ACFNJN_05840, partial [Capnocytophaga ochracea]